MVCPGEILSEILVRTIFGCLVTPKTSLNNKKWFAPKFHSKFRQEFENDSQNGLTQKTTKLNMSKQKKGFVIFLVKYQLNGKN